MNINAALRLGRRGLPGGMTLKQLSPTAGRRRFSERGMASSRVTRRNSHFFARKKELFTPLAALMGGDALRGQGTSQVARDPGGISRLHLQTLFSVGVTAGLTDGQLLERFATQPGDAAELAFGALVERHGPMVFHACRGILGDEHEAQDAFQATFLVLLRKGGTLWVRDSLGPWLHRVACRAAGRARVDALHRRAHERRAAEQAAGSRGGESRSDRAAILHEELDRLPERYRVPIVLCDLQGRAYEEAGATWDAQWGRSGAGSRRGRERLRGRLTRRGLAPAAGWIAAELTADAARAAVCPLPGWARPPKPQIACLPARR